MIGILHGYLLDGSGSNLWTRSVVSALCELGHTVQLVCQERHPEAYEFIAEALAYEADGAATPLLQREVATAGRCVMHRPELGATLPVYVWDQYEGFERVVPMIELDDDEVEEYIARNVAAVGRVVRERGVTALLANHSVLMSVVAQRVAADAGIPFAIMPHGSAIEFAVKKDRRFLAYAESAFAAADRVFVIGPELRQRVLGVLAGVPDLENKMTPLNLGVDTDRFEIVGRDARAASVAELARIMGGIPRGKEPSQSDELRRTLAEPGAGLANALNAGSDYDAKLPDADVEAKLRRIDWQRVPTILFVGRLVASKGAQSVVAALPEILRHEPEARLLIVGHGPLREALEGMLYALEVGDRALFEGLVAHGRRAEGGEGGPFAEVACFLDDLRARGELDAYFAAGEQYLRRGSVAFTGYLAHRYLRFLFPCADVAVFPSIVAEAGPLVFLEALACGCFPLGTYFAGMGASIDAVGAGLPPGELALMKLRPEPAHTVADIAANTAGALGLGGKHAERFRQIAVADYDWKGIARRLAQQLKAKLS